jgi:hypothetical protein
MCKNLTQTLAIVAMEIIVIGCNRNNSYDQSMAINTTVMETSPQKLVVYTPKEGKHVFSVIKRSMVASGLPYDVKIMEEATTELTIRGLKDGMFDLIFLHLPPRPDEGIKFFELVRVNVAIFTHPNISVENLTTGQIATIFAGEITSWSDVGGSNQDIAVSVLPEFDSPTEVLRNVILGGKPFAESAQIFPDETSVMISAAGIPDSSDYASWVTKKHLEFAQPNAKSHEFHAISVVGMAVDADVHRDWFQLSPGTGGIPEPGL